MNSTLTLPASHSRVFFKNLVAFRDVRNAMNSGWKSISTGAIETLRNVDFVESSANVFDPEMRQQNIECVPVNSIEELYMSAEMANIVFENELKKLVAETGLNMDYLRLAPLKGRERATEKAKDDYNDREPGHGERWLFDIVRGSLMCETEVEILTVLTYFRNHCKFEVDTENFGKRGMEVVRLKNRFRHPTPSGFRDINANIRVTFASPTGKIVQHICEIQIHCKAVKELCLSLGSHGIYEYFRTFFRGSVETISNRIQLLDAMVGETFHDTTADQSAVKVPVDTSTGALSLLVDSIVSEQNSDRMDSVCKLLDLMCEHDLHLRVKQAMLDIVEEKHGPDHEYTVLALANLGEVLATVGDTEAAVGHFQKALTGMETHYGREHATTLDVVNSIGCLLVDVGDLDGARAMYERALTGQEKVYGAAHPQTLGTAYNLGNLLCRLQDYKLARPLLERALTGFELSWGLDHGATLNVANSLGNLLKDIGDLDKALAMYQRALQGREKLYGLNHSLTLGTVNNLGNLLAKIGDLSGARVMYERALCGKEEIFGREHADTLLTVMNMGNLLRDAGDMVAALSMTERALAGFEKLFGPAHGHSATAQHSLGHLLFEIGDVARAEPLLRKALEAKEKIFGIDHIALLQTLNSLGSLLASVGNFPAARDIYGRAHEIAEKISGSDSEETLQMRERLVTVLQRIRDFRAAQALLEVALTRLEKLHGPTHITIARTIHALISLLESQGDYEGSRAMLDREIQICKDIFGPDHPATLDCASRLEIDLSRPAIIQHACHPHRLSAVSRQRRSFAICDFCRVGNDCAYFCGLCDFDCCNKCLADSSLITSREDHDEGSR